MKISYLLLLVLAPILSAEEVNIKAWQGVWQGKVGQAAVHVCMQQSSYGVSGAYYYDKYRKVIVLRPPEAKVASADSLAWVERDDERPKNARNTWQLPLPVGPLLTGTWTDGRKQVVIQLKRIISPSHDDIGDCGSDAFNAPLERPVPVMESAAELDGVAYRYLSTSVGEGDSFSSNTFQLNGAGPTIQRINSELHKYFLGGGDFYDCTRSLLEHFGEYGGEARSDTQPTLLLKNWLTVHVFRADSCGGAHPNAEDIYLVWNLKTGKIFNPWFWFHGRSAKVTANTGSSSDGSYNEVEVMDSLQKELLRRWPRNDDDCKNVPVDAHWMLHPEKGGMVFTPSLPHAIYACTEDIVMPYAALKPYLNEKGKVEVAAIQAEIAALPVKRR